MSNNREYDIIILGGGMVGAALACALENIPLKIALLDRFKPNFDWPIEGYELRVSALTYASQQILKKIGAWDKMVARRVSPFTDMHVWDATGDGEIQFHAEDIGKPCLGHIVENRVTQGALFEQLETLNNVDYLQPIVAKSIQSDANKTTLRLDNGDTITAKLIVGADGGRSWVRDQANIQLNSYNYEQKGVVTTVKTTKHHNQVARQRFLPTGPLAFLPLTEGRCSIVWSTNYEDADRLVALEEKAFMVELESALGESDLGHVETVSQRAAFPLIKQHAERYCDNRLVLVGDAAHTIHPLAGQGVNLGLLDIATLAEELISATGKRRDIGSQQVLRKYERRRKGDNTLMLNSMDGFHLLFANDNKMLSQARNIGLKLTNNILPVKSKLIEHAMGIDRKIPLVQLSAE